MNILCCVEFYWPSVGGAQEVVRQIAQGLVVLGHRVTVATTMMDSRVSDEHNGVKIVGFNVAGNAVRGMYGDLDRYREFVLGGSYDAILIYAAQQWTLDALLDLLPVIKARKILVPCGFSGYFYEEYKSYFKRLENDLKLFDQLIFHAREYRDYNFALSNGCANCNLVPNGAGSDEFIKPPTGVSFRERFKISPESLIVLTVGSLNGAKGHLEVAEAVASLDSKKDIFVVLNGNKMPLAPPPEGSQLGLLVRKAKTFLKKITFRNVVRGLQRVGLYALKKFGLATKTYKTLEEVVLEINAGKHGKNKKAMIVDLPRDELLSCFFEADLFVFASHIEYSPLVLFEAAAAGLPFLTVPVGNATEIAAWTGGGRICPAVRNERGYTRVNPTDLAESIEELIQDEVALSALGQSGRAAWLEFFTWQKLVRDYEAVITGQPLPDRVFAEPSEDINIVVR